ncbi:hypothetical protein IPL68_07450 [Candidatus Saccharibacteria bacterium]|nr:MAG: hypothetical protein IPL68_07450 [Candidatus Saccharibacteria bacterium]
MEEINLYDLVRYYLKHWRVIAICTAAGLLLGVIYTFFLQTPQYKSNATLLIVNTNQSAGSQDTTLNDYIELFKSRRVLEPVIQEQKLAVSYNQFVGSVGTTNDKGTQVIKVSITNPDARKSQASANSAVRSFKKQVQALYKKDNVQVVDSASLPIQPYNVHRSTQFALATMAGFILAVIGLFFAFDFKESKLGGKALRGTEPAMATLSLDSTRMISAVEMQAQQAAALQAKQAALLTVQQEREAAETAAREAKERRKAAKKKRQVAKVKAKAEKKAQKAEIKAEKRAAKLADKKDRAAARRAAKAISQQDRQEKKVAKRKAKTKSPRRALGLSQRLAVIARNVSKKLSEDWEETPPEAAMSFSSAEPLAQPESIIDTPAVPSHVPVPKVPVRKVAPPATTQSATVEPPASESVTTAPTEAAPVTSTSSPAKEEPVAKKKS